MSVHHTPPHPDRPLGAILLILFVLPIAAAFVTSLLTVTELARSQAVWDNFYGRDRNFGGYWGKLIAFPLYHTIVVLGAAHLLSVGLAHRRTGRSVAVVLLYLGANMLPLYGGVPILVFLAITLVTAFAAVSIPSLLVEPGIWIFWAAGALGGGAAFGALVGIGARLIEPTAVPGRQRLRAYVWIGMVAGAALALTAQSNFGLNAETPRETVAQFLSWFIGVGTAIGIAFGLIAVGTLVKRLPDTRQLVFFVILVIAAGAIVQTATMAIVDSRQSLSSWVPMLEPVAEFIRLFRPLSED